MFCSKCGKQMADDVKFCPGCGASAGSTAGAQTVPAVPATTENINSGVPLTATAQTLHRQLVSILSESPQIPLDVFDNAEVIREEHYYVSAYCFEYNGEAPFSYEEGKQDTRQERGFSGENETITTIKEVKWHTERGTASVSGTLFISGNKKMAPYINKMYINTDHNQLVDFEFPPDAETLEYDLPQVAAFNEHVKPFVDYLLTEDAKKKELKGKSYEEHIPRGGVYGVTYARDFKLSGSRIQKDVTQIFLGLYRVVYKYRNQEFSMWVNGNGKEAIHEGLPVDLQRKTVLEQKEKEKEQGMASITHPKTGLLNFGKWMGIIIGISGVISTCALIYEYGSYGALGALVFLAGLLLAILCGVPRSKKIKAYNAQRSEAEAKFNNDIDGFKGEVTTVIQQFKAKKKALRGIYEKVSGDASAF